MKNENNKLIKMISAKVAELVSQGMSEKDAFSVVMRHLKTKHPAVFNFLCLMHTKGFQ